MKESSSSTHRDGFDRLAAALFYQLPASEITMSLQRIGVTPEKLRPHRHFLQTFFTTVLDTYLGGDGLQYSAAERQGHFHWCLTSTLAQLGETGYRYADNEDLLEYLSEYLRLELYKADELPTLAQLHSLLDAGQVNTRAELTAFMELWEIFEKTPIKGRRLRVGKAKA